MMKKLKYLQMITLNAHFFIMKADFRNGILIQLILGREEDKKAQKYAHLSI